MSEKQKEKVKETRNYWKKEEETIIQHWSDKAQCYQWMHSRCREIYQSKNAWFTIPVIIISTVTGTANFAQDRFDDDTRQYVVMGIGSLSIIAGIITTIYQFLKISEINEGHRVAAISWMKFHNNLKTLILRHPLDRMAPSDAIKIYQEEYDRLIEVSPVIIKKVLARFNSEFRKNETLVKPEIGNTLDPTEIYDMSDHDRQKMIDRINNTNKNKNKKFIDTFFNINGREPDATEISGEGNSDGGSDGNSDGGSDGGGDDTDNINIDISSSTTEV